ncbi:MAG: radical SAM family heme chaperone HemW [Firmicutes bacterium]|nr:radical SAM family heme chaperone HemW [Bacillota bacterium]
METSVYIHIPFCRAKCYYCDFLSFAYSATNFSPRDYVRALIKELSIRGQQLSDAGIMVSTLYIGGGTPTALPTVELATLLDNCHRYLPLSSPEWTVEANPGTITPELVKLLGQAGVNRISLGVQDLDDHRLALLGRLHTAARAQQAFLLCQDSFPSVSLDIMAALPGQTEAQLLTTLATVCDWAPQHLSVYGLKVEEGTPLATQVASGHLQLPDEDETLAMFLSGRQFLQAQGYQHYEIANFAQTGHRSLHNQTYWHNHPYLGLGLGAHSYWQGRRLENTCQPELYLQQLAMGQLPLAVSHAVTREQEMEDTMMLGLRLLSGVRFDVFQARFQQDLRHVFAKEIKHLLALGAIVTDNTAIRLSEAGLPVANLVFAEFLR